MQKHGIRGAGVFENDAACDMLNSFRDMLVKHIESCLYKMERDARDFWEIDSYLAALSMYHLLILEIQLAPPEPNTVRHWRKGFSKWWEDAVVNAITDGDVEYARNHQLPIENTFNSLIELADNAYRKFDDHRPYIHTWKWQPVLLTENKNHFTSHQLDFLKLFVQSRLYDFENDTVFGRMSNVYKGNELLAAAFILRLLYEKSDYRPIHETIVNGWKQKYLTWFDSLYSKDGKQSEYYLKRIEVVKETFDDLIYLSRNWIPHHQRQPKAP